MTRACRISELVAHLQQHQNDEFVLCSLWYEEDVHDVDDSVTEDETRQVLSLAARYHDAEVGINRDVLRAALDVVRQSPGKPPEIREIPK